ncbi:MAG TPA: hypothetical protein VNU45_00300 [Rummeliibacillus sp.]|nr:hypothetical protein [Rummeliibacillus sp.]
MNPGYYGSQVKLDELNRYLKTLEINDINELEKYSALLMLNYLKDADLISDPESLLNAFKYPSLIKSIFRNRYDISFSDYDTFMSPEDACSKLLKIASMDGEASFEEVFSENFLDGFYKDCNMLLEDQKTVSSIFS